jgi:hypothetical protein
MLLAQSFPRPEPPFHYHPQKDVNKSTNAGLCLKHPCVDADCVSFPIKDNKSCALGLGATTRDQVDQLLTNLDRPSSTSSHHNRSQIVRDSLHDCNSKLSLSIFHRVSFSLHHHRAALTLNCYFGNLLRLSFSLSTRTRLLAARWLPTAMRLQIHNLVIARIKPSRAHYGTRGMVLQSSRIGKKRTLRSIYHMTIGKVPNT